MSDSASTPKTPVGLSQAKQVADDCLAVARFLADRQNDDFTLKSRQVTEVVNATLSASNLLNALDCFDPFAPVRAGFKRTHSRTPDGRLVITFEELPLFAQEQSCPSTPTDSPAPTT